MADVIKLRSQLKNRQSVARGGSTVSGLENRKIHIAKNQIPKHPYKRQGKRKNIRENSQTIIAIFLAVFNFPAIAELLLAALAAAPPKPMKNIHIRWLAKIFLSFNHFKIAFESNRIKCRLGKFFLIIKAKSIWSSRLLVLLTFSFTLN